MTTVRELINKLSAVDQDLEIFIANNVHNGDYDTEELEDVVICVDKEDEDEVVVVLTKTAT